MSGNWKLAACGLDGNVELFGVNIFRQKWIDTHERTCVKEISNPIWVYHVKIKGVQYEFAAGEVSCCVWLFYVRED